MKGFPPPEGIERTNSMKKLKAIEAVLALIMVSILALAVGTVCAQEQAIKMEDLEKLAREGLANAEGTRKIVAEAIEKTEKGMSKDASQLLKGEVQGAKMWFKKGDDLLTKCKQQIELKKFTKELVIDINQAWRWLVEAGSEIVRASMME